MLTTLFVAPETAGSGKFDVSARLRSLAAARSGIDQPLPPAASTSSATKASSSRARLPGAMEETVKMGKTESKGGTSKGGALKKEKAGAKKEKKTGSDKAGTSQVCDTYCTCVRMLTSPIADRHGSEDYISHYDWTGALITGSEQIVHIHDFY